MRNMVVGMLIGYPPYRRSSHLFRSAITLSKRSRERPTPALKSNHRVRRSWPYGFRLSFLTCPARRSSGTRRSNLKLSKHLDRMVEEVGCNLKVVERSEATAY